MTITETEAYEAIRTHHRTLGDRLSERVSEVSSAAAAGEPHEAAVARLIAYIAGEILPHAAAEEATLYPAAAALDGLADTVRLMIAEHKVLAEAAGRLAHTAGAADAAAHAQGIARLFAGHVAKENDVLLPALVASKDADLAALLADMHRRTEEVGQPRQADGADVSALQAMAQSQLRQATTALAQAGETDRSAGQAEDHDGR